MDESRLRAVLEKLQDGQNSIDEVVHHVQSIMRPTQLTADARVDLDRADRCGFAEVVYCPGKEPGTVVEIFRQQYSAGQDCLGTRVGVEQANAVQHEFPQAEYDSVARTIRVMHSQNDETGDSGLGPVYVVSAGTTDRTVAREALETLRWMRCRTELFEDVGVAGPHRILEVLPELRSSVAVVVVAGMEGALPSVVGGHLDCPVFAVPTSVGYGANLGGLAALLGMLNSCASNVSVVNIDAGFKAAYVAGTVARQIAAAVKQRGRLREEG